MINYSKEFFLIFNLILLSLTLISIFSNKKLIVKFIIFFQLIISSTFVGLRGDMGSDTLNYISYFILQNKSKHVVITSELGLDVLAWLISFISNNPYTYLYIVSFLSVIILVLSYKNIAYFKDVPIINYLFFSSATFYLMFGNTIAQGLASAFIILAISFYIEQKKLIYIFLIILASLFHKSAIIFILIYPLTKIMPQKRSWLVFIFGGGILFNMFSLVYLRFGFIPNSISNLIKNESNNNLLIFKLLLSLLLILFMYFLLSKINSQKLNILFKIYTFAVSLSFYSFVVSEISSRLLYYSNFLVPVIIMEIIKILRFKKYILFLVILLTFFYNFFVINYPSIKLNFGF